MRLTHKGAMGPLITVCVSTEGLGVRHAQTALLFALMLLGYMMRVNMSMAIVSMTEPTNPKHFNWDLGMQSVILSSFFWGYVVLQIPAGELSRRLGGKVLNLNAIFTNSVVSLVIPLSAVWGGWLLVCVCRVLQGVAQSVMYPATHHLISLWIPLEEKGRLVTIIYAGTQLGITLQMVLSGFLGSAWGWEAIFYTDGALGLLWSVAYSIYGSASPEKSKLISPEERLFIQTSLNRVGEQKRYATPWGKILMSLPFWGVIVAHCGQNWGYFTLMTEMPTYMAKVLNFSLKDNGMLSALPFLSMYILSFPMGFMSDMIVNKKWLSLTHTRKLFNSIGMWGPAIAMIGLAYAPVGNNVYAVVMLCVTVGINSGFYVGLMLVDMDMAPNFSGPLMGIGNCIANIVSIIAPLVCGFIIQDERDTAEWRKVFFLASGIYFFTNLFFVLFATSERQSWNEPNSTTTLEPNTGAESAKSVAAKT